MPFTYEYPRPAFSVDTVVLTHDREPRVLLIRRRHEPFAGSWALPGGFVEENEPPAVAAQRELREETGVDAPDLALLGVFGDPGRDPRGWTVSAVYLVRMDAQHVHAIAADDAADVDWHPLHRLPALAFDHAKILANAQARLLAQGA